MNWKWVVGSMFNVRQCLFRRSGHAVFNCWLDGCVTMSIRTGIEQIRWRAKITPGMFVRHIFAFPCATLFSDNAICIQSLCFSSVC